MARFSKVDKVVKDGRQAYRVRWDEKQQDGSWRAREQRVYGHLFPNDVVEVSQRIGLLDWDALA